MSFEIKKVYTDNPYVDEMVYYTKLMAIDTVLKMQSVADNNETVESLQRAGLYISCVEGTATFNIFDEVTVAALNAAGIVDPLTVQACLINKNRVPESKREAVTAALRQEYIDSYEELNPYYRALNGLPPVGEADYVTDWIPPDGVVIDLDKPIHEMNNAEVSILNNAGILDNLYDQDPVGKMYLRHLGKKKIDIYFARRAQRFDVLYVPTIDSDAIAHMFREKLDNNKFYILRTVYSEAFNYNSDYYDNFIAVFIVIITMVDIISRVQEFIARKEIFDIRSVQYIFKSFGVPFFENIPLKYQIAMVKNLHTFLKYKSTAKCMVDICSLFGFDNIKIFKYYLLRDRKVDLSTGEYVYAVDEEGNEILDEEYELKFLKLPLDEDLDDYIRVGGNYIDYDEITEGDSKWDGGLDHDMIMQEILKEEFNFTRTKYISIDTIYDIAKISAQQTYFFNLIFDNVDLESLVTVQVPYIEPGREFKVSDLFTLLTVLSYYYMGTKDVIMDTHSKVLYVNGFNFKADLATLAQEIGPKYITGTMVDHGSTLHAQEQLANFIIPESSIPSFNEMMEIYVNNMEIRDELLKGMNEADNKRVYDVYKKLYDALCTVELTMEHYQRPDAPLDPDPELVIEGDWLYPSNMPEGYDGAYAFGGTYWYRYQQDDNGNWKWGFAPELYYYCDEEGDPTYAEYLKHRDIAIYDTIITTQEFEDDLSRNAYISNLIDSIVYALEEFIDTDEFQGLFSNLPVVSSEAVKQYICTVINFYKSYKVDFLGMNTIYTFDDKDNGVIRLIDDVFLKRFFQKEEFVKLYTYIAQNRATMTKIEKAALIERIYLDIRTWAMLEIEDYINIRDEIYELLAKLALYTIINMTEKYEMSSKQIWGEVADFFDTIEVTSTFSPYHNLGISERLWIYEEGSDGEPSDNNALDRFMSIVSSSDFGRVIVANSEGDSVASLYITEDIDAEDASAEFLVTEESVVNYVEENVVPKDDVVTDISDEASTKSVTSESAVVAALSFNLISGD